MSDPTEPLVTLRGPDGNTTQVPLSQSSAYLNQGYHQESAAEAAQRVGQEARESHIGAVESFGQAAGRTLTLGATDALQRVMAPDTAAQYLRDAESAHPTATVAGTVTGAVLPALLTGGESVAAEIAAATPMGRAAQLGRSIAALGEGGGTVARIGAKVAGGFAEGAAIGAGQGVSELAMSDDPLTWEHAVSAIGSNALFGGALGGATGLVGGTLEAGLGRAKRALDEAAAAKAAAPAVDTDLAELDLKGLSKARESELATIEAARVPERQSIADELASFRQDLKQQKLWLATKDSENAEIKVIGKQSFKADRQLDQVLDNPKALAENPRRALAGLQQQEHALEQLGKKADELRASFGADQSGERAAALDAAPKALERNRALQARIKSVLAEPSSPRLQAIADAKDVLQSGGPKKSLAEEMLGGTIFHKTSEAAAGLAGALPLAGGLVGPIAGGLAARVVTKAVFGRLAKATLEQTQKMSSAVGMIAQATNKATRAAAPIATSILAALRFAPAGAGAAAAGAGSASKPTLAEAYAARTAEIRSQTAYDETGTPKMRPAARQAMADQLSPIRAVAPVAADRMETAGARRIEYLASVIPKRPDIATVSVGGKDTWQASDMQMRTFARICDAVERPENVEKRIATGAATPEDIAAYRGCYPARAAAFQAQIISAIAQRPTKLPYPQRLALTMFGIPADSSMHPVVLNQLQGAFLGEPGTNGGGQPARAQPQFGSVKKSISQPTPAQRRGQGLL